MYMERFQMNELGGKLNSFQWMVHRIVPTEYHPLDTIQNDQIAGVSSSSNWMGKLLLDCLCKVHTEMQMFAQKRDQIVFGRYQTYDPNELTILLESVMWSPHHGVLPTWKLLIEKSSGWWMPEYCIQSNGVQWNGVTSCTWYTSFDSHPMQTNSKWFVPLIFGQLISGLIFLMPVTEQHRQLLRIESNWLSPTDRLLFLSISNAYLIAYWVHRLEFRPLG